MKEKTVLIKKLIGDYALSMEKGIVLHKVLLQNINDDIKTTIDFTGVQTSSPFFNASISYLIKDVDIKSLQKYLEIKGLTKDARQVLNISIHNAINKYKK